MTRACDLGVWRPESVADLDWPAGEAAALGRGAVDLWEGFLERLPSLPVHRGFSAAAVAEGLAWDVPDEPDDPARLLADTRDLMLEWSMYPGHGGFFGYVSGAGTIPGAAADLLAAAMNNMNRTGFTGDSRG